MTTYNNAVAWAVLIPIVILGILLAALAIGYYRSMSRSLDIFLLSFLFSLFFNVAVVVLIQAVIFLASGANWSLRLCQFYIWATFTSRLAGLFNITALAIDRVLILRKPRSYKYHGSTSVKIAVIILWVFCAFIGAVPIVGWKNVSFFVDNRCLYISNEIDRGMGIFVICITLASATISMLCLLDAFLHLRYLKRHNIFTVDPGESRISEIIAQNGRDKPGTGTPTCVDLASAFDSCRLVCVITAMYFILNQLPYCAICLTGILLHYSSDSIHVVALWFMVLECLLIPQVLWCCNTRYRNGYRHIPDVLLCKAAESEDEGDGIQLSGFKQHEIRSANSLVAPIELSNGGHTLIEVNPKENHKIHRRGLSNSDPQVNRANGMTSSVTVQVHTLPRALSFDSHIDVSKNERDSNAVSSEMVSSRNLQLNKTVIDEMSSSESTSKKIQERRQVRKTSHRDRTDSSKSPSKSRTEWREAMRKKHLPHLFTDEALQESHVYENVGFQASIDLDDEEIAKDVNNINVLDQPSTSQQPTNGQISQNQTVHNLAQTRSDSIQVDFRHKKALSVASSQITESDVTDAPGYGDTDIADILDTASLSTTTGSISPYVQNQLSISVDDICIDVQETEEEANARSVLKSNLSESNEINSETATGDSDLETSRNETTNFTIQTEEKRDDLLVDGALESSMNGIVEEITPVDEKRVQEIESTELVNSEFNIEENVYNKDIITKPRMENITFSTFGKSFDSSVYEQADDVHESELNGHKEAAEMIAPVIEPHSQDNQGFTEHDTGDDKHTSLTFSTFGKGQSFDQMKIPDSALPSDINSNTSNHTNFSDYNQYPDAWSSTIKPYEEAFTSFSANDLAYFPEDRGHPSRSSASPFEDDFSDVTSTQASIEHDFDQIPDLGVEGMHSASPIQHIWGDEITENSDFQSFNDMSKFYSLDNPPLSNTIFDSRLSSDTSYEPLSSWSTFEEDSSKMTVPTINIQGATPPSTLTRTKPQDIWGPVSQTNDSVASDVTGADTSSGAHSTNPFASDDYVKFEKINSEENSSEPELGKPINVYNTSFHTRSNESTPVADREVDEIFSTNFASYEHASTSL